MSHPFKSEHYFDGQDGNRLRDDLKDAIEASIHLHNAAPELLDAANKSFEALCEALSELRDYSRDHPSIKLIDSAMEANRAAIAKAKGTAS